MFNSIYIRISLVALFQFFGSSTNLWLWTPNFGLVKVFVMVVIYRNWRPTVCICLLVMWKIPVLWLPFFRWLNLKFCGSPDQLNPIFGVEKSLNSQTFWQFHQFHPTFWCLDPHPHVLQVRYWGGCGDSPQSDSCDWHYCGDSNSEKSEIGKLWEILLKYTSHADRNLRDWNPKLFGVERDPV